MWELTQTAPTTDLYVVRRLVVLVAWEEAAAWGLIFYIPVTKRDRQPALNSYIYTVVGTLTINPIPSIRDTWWLGTHRREQKNMKKCTSFTGIRTTFICTAGLALARGYRISQTMSIIQGLSRIRDNGKREICGFRFCVLWKGFRLKICAGSMEWIWLTCGAY